jgi:hypothetical protein
VHKVVLFVINSTSEKKTFYLQAVENPRLETLQILGIEMFTGGSTESNVRSFLTLHEKCNMYIIKSLLKKKPIKKRNNEIITQ